ncbi:DUF1735 domain-containing protein [Flagellimonas amoyensis]|uniref:DUF1735 domain-containing protein n=1 Tax=Flagellimonas amoyensis TaxID=2169401 RepID=UPI000D3A3BC2|nr:DUF1735 domain-containing protein [Allomuricauda amoyensis]
MKKNINKIGVLSLFSCLLLFISCDWDESNYDSLTKELDPNATYYIQFKDASQTLESGFDPSGEIIDIESTITVVLLGTPRAQDISVDLSLDPASTIEASMYEIGTTSLTIPAGETSASTTFRTITENMVEEELVTFILNIDMGENNATSGTTLNYELTRLAPCRPVPGTYTIEMADSYGDGWQTDGGNGGNGITIDLDGNIIEVGLCSPYEGSDYDCTGFDTVFDSDVLDWTSGTATFEIPEGTQSAKWFFPGDAYGEISFKVYGPEGELLYSVSTGEGVAGQLPIENCIL